MEITYVVVYDTSGKISEIVVKRTDGITVVVNTVAKGINVSSYATNLHPEFLRSENHISVMPYENQSPK